ncbi:aminopeptidase N [Sesbania bispinosa]|nr:aminopeptidase N [Sesbania bispinosa]
MSFNAPGIASFVLLQLDSCWTWKIRWCTWRSNDCYCTSTAAAWMRTISFYLDEVNELLAAWTRKISCKTWMRTICSCCTSRFAGALG